MPPRRTSYIPALDGVRGIAVVAVLLFHHHAVFHDPAGQAFHDRYLAWLDLGWCGVDLFFVLSGFLITGILLESRETTNYFRAFYARRSLRIFPLYYGYLLLVLVGFPLVFRLLLHDNPWQAVQPGWYFSYLSNWQNPAHSGDPQLLHLWSLAVEEQFYLVWPLVVYLTSRRQLAAVCGTLAVLALGSRAALHSWPMASLDPYRITLTRLDALAAGALIALAIQTPAWRAWLGQRRAGLAAGLALGTLLCCLWRWPSLNWEASPLVPTLLAVLFSYVVLRCATGGLNWLAHPGLRHLGKYSYAMYLFHLLPVVVSLRLRGFAGHFAPAMATAIKLGYMLAALVLTYVLARLSWTCVESPLLQYKKHFEYQRPETTTSPQYAKATKVAAAAGID